MVFLKTLQYSQENTCVEASLITLQTCNSIKKRLQHMFSYFPVNIAKEHLRMVAYVNSKYVYMLLFHADSVCWLRLSFAE